LSVLLALQVSHSGIVKITRMYISWRNCEWVGAFSGKTHHSVIMYLARC